MYASGRRSGVTKGSGERREGGEHIYCTNYLSWQNYERTKQTQFQIDGYDNKLGTCTFFMARTLSLTNFGS